MKNLIKLLVFLVPFSLCAQTGVRYVVMWEARSLVSIPCPDAEKPDEYTGQTIGGLRMVCAVFHAKWIVNRNMKKDFNEKEKAIKFVENALDDGAWTQLRDFKLMQISGVDTTLIEMPPRDKE